MCKNSTMNCEMSKACWKSSKCNIIIGNGIEQRGGSLKHEETTDYRFYTVKAKVLEGASYYCWYN